MRGQYSLVANVLGAKSLSKWILASPILIGALDQADFKTSSLTRKERNFIMHILKS